MSKGKAIYEEEIDKKELLKVMREIMKCFHRLEKRIEKLEQVNDYPNKAELARMAECEGTG